MIQSAKEGSALDDRSFVALYCRNTTTGLSSQSMSETPLHTARKLRSNLKSIAYVTWPSHLWRDSRHVTPWLVTWLSPISSQKVTCREPRHEWMSHVTHPKDLISSQSFAKRSQHTSQRRFAELIKWKSQTYWAQQSFLLITCANGACLLTAKERYTFCKRVLYVSRKSFALYFPQKSHIGRNVHSSIAAIHGSIAHGTSSKYRHKSIHFHPLIWSTESFQQSY